jgi:hypothetical protein
MPQAPQKKRTQNLPGSLYTTYGIESAILERTLRPLRAFLASPWPEGKPVIYGGKKK